MDKRPVRLVLMLSLMAISSLLFTNCDQHAFEPQAGSGVGAPASGSGNAYNGGGHSGKVSYLFTHADEDACLYPQLGLEVENGQTRAFSYECASNPVETNFVASDLIQIKHDPYFLIYKSKIYAHNSLLQLANNERAEFQVFCTNATYENRGLDFAVKYTRVYTSKPYTITEGYLLRGNGGLEPSVAKEQGRYRDPTAQGVRLFQSSSGGYDVEVTPVSSTEATGVMTLKASGERIPFECVLKAPAGSGAG